MTTSITAEDVLYAATRDKLLADTAGLDYTARKADPTREQMIARHRAAREAAHNAQCREQAAKGSVVRNQIAVAATQRAVTEAVIRLRKLADPE